MTVQALRVLVTSRYADAGRIGRRLHVLHVNARDALDLVFHWAVDGVVGMTCITGHVRGNPVVLKVLRWNECRIVYVEASTVRHHDVARSAEFRLFGALHVDVHASDNAQRRKHAKSDESHNLPAGTSCNRGPNQKDGGESKAENDLNDQNSGHKAPGASSMPGDASYAAQTCHFFLPSSRMYATRFLI
jgi:hypothetical protein